MVVVVAVTAVTMLSTSCTVLGTMLLLHAAYSCLHFKALLQELDIPLDDTTNNNTIGTRIPPSDVVVECVLGLLMIFVGQLLESGGSPWQPCMTTTTTSTTTTKTSSTRRRRPLAAPAFRTRDFDIYADRAAAIYHYNTNNKSK